ncbi:MAG: PQQ-binding-like beta-propeller repeat protein [Vicinamibacterales bacterium]
MIGRRFRFAAAAILVLTTGAWLARPSGQAPAGQAVDGNWIYYGGDARNWRYKPFDQINATNFSDLQVAWRFRTDNLGPNLDFRLGATAIEANGVVYVNGGGMRRSVAAIDAANGTLLWVHTEDEGNRAAFAPRVTSGRGVSYWTDGREERIIYVTTGYRMKALNAKTGQLIPTFGESGVIDLKKDFDQDLSRFARNGEDALTMADIGLHASPVIGKDTIVVGAAGREGTTPFRLDEVKGYVRAFDVRTGKRLWTFHTVPQKGEFGYDTWANGTDKIGHVGVWTQMAIDEELGMVYLPVETPTNDYYGANRPGNNLFAESLVALDLRTGQRKWHFQIVHHPLWDLDLSSAPILADITVNGRAIKAVAMPSKQSFLYVFDRVTGQPVWPIEERAVPKSEVPGEVSAPTQPYPTKPPAYARQNMSVDELIDFTPDLRAKALEISKKYALAKLFDPLVLSRPEGPYKSLLMSSALGGTNWPGGSYDPETHTVFASANQQVVGLGLLKVTDTRFSEAEYVGGDALAGLRDVQGHSGDGPRLNGGRAPAKPVAPGNPNPPPGMGAGFLSAPTVEGLPINKPPYGVISAINLDRGELSWSVPHGDTPDAIRNHPALKGLAIPRTGQQTSVGTIVTKDLVIAGEPSISTAGHPRGALLRAYDKRTGKDAGSVLMDAPQTGSPMTYMWKGRQYIIATISGPATPGQYVAFALPDSTPRRTQQGGAN